FSLIVLAVLFVAIVAAVVMVQEGQRRIPVQYAKRVVGRRMYGGQATHIPLRVNNAGVIPVIFRSEEHTSELQSRENLVCRLLLARAARHSLALSLHDALPISLA